MIKILYSDDVHLKVDCDASTAQELSDFFTFDVPGAKFMPAVRNRVWDGKIRLFNSVTRTVYAGLAEYIEEFCKARNYQCEVDPKLSALVPVSDKDIDDLASSIGLTLEPRDYQKEAISYSMAKKRCLLLSPTASGKSLIIYMLCRNYPMKKLLIVPTTGLVHQMASDFKEYGYNDYVHKITAGADKTTDAEITVTTWQSIYKMPRKWFKQYKVVIGDEAHLFKAKSLVSIMSKLEACPYRYGFTGTLDGSQTHRLVLEGLFGPVHQVTTTSELMKQQVLASLKINICILGHSESNKKTMARAKYRDEINYLVDNKPRNEFLVQMCDHIKGNTLMLFTFVDSHGKVLYNMAKDQDRKVFFVHGGVKGETRDQIRSIVEKEDNALIIASYGTFSTGVNIRRISNIVFAAPSKSKIRVLQSIGRGLRKVEDKDTVRLFDVVDDLRHKNWINFTLKHYTERLKIYNDEQFDYKILSHNIGD
jgi:superfamily II DNA or RNA helicase|tara:strand:- start:5441 stop:6874 length:1434 start_codon:yes stop_codon:yes gene_type:complete